MNERSKIILRLLTTHVYLVFGLIVLTFFLKNNSLMMLSVSLCILIITFFTGYWEFFGIKFKWVYTIFMTIAIFSMFVWKLNGYLLDMNSLTFIILSIILAFLILQLLKILIVIFEKGKSYFEIEFPLKNGRFLITDGGNSKISRLMNYHYYSKIHKKNKTNRSMLYATDLVKLSNTTKSLLPIHNEDYPIYNDTVYSPMDGIIFKIVNGISDNKPFSGNYPYNSGNTIVIKNNNYYFLLGHLKFNSIEVNEGEKIKRGQKIAKIGNSGWTERPHLHMQLINSENENYWYGTGVSLKYKNRNLYKNRIIEV